MGRYWFRLLVGISFFVRARGVIRGIKTKSTRLTIPRGKQRKRNRPQRPNRTTHHHHLRRRRFLAILHRIESGQSHPRLHLPLERRDRRRLHSPPIPQLAATESTTERGRGFPTPMAGPGSQRRHQAAREGTEAAGPGFCEPR